MKGDETYGRHSFPGLEDGVGAAEQAVHVTPLQHNDILLNLLDFKTENDLSGLTEDEQYKAILQDILVPTACQPAIVIRARAEVHK